MDRTSRAKSEEKASLTKQIQDSGAVHYSIDQISTTSQLKEASNQSDVRSNQSDGGEFYSGISEV